MSTPRTQELDDSKVSAQNPVLPWPFPPIGTYTRHIDTDTETTIPEKAKPVEPALSRTWQPSGR